MWRWQADRFGPPDQVLRLVEAPEDPPPGPGQVRLVVRAVGLNFLDVMVCRGEYPQQPPPPVTPGVEVVGQVVAAGPGAEALLGREVIACPTFPAGGLAEQVTVSVGLVVPRPPELPPVAAAGLPVIYQTAATALARAGLQAGQTVLVLAAAGGVGIATIQLARARGARVVAAAGGPEKLAYCREQGVDALVDYRQEDLAAAVRAATGGYGADVVVDPVGGELSARALDCLAFEGRLVAVGTAAGQPPPVDPTRLMASNQSVIGVSWGSSYPWRRPAQVAATYQELFELYRQGLVRPPVSRVVPFQSAASALADLAARRSTGKLVVEMGGD
ncbi:MAG TPA: zinc-binding dehydrogenase [Natronosporangium sp.]|nr:zinc-binding dehydrogenase [Natronosporangium sp.]